MVAFVIGIVLLLIAVVMVIAAFGASKSEDRVGAGAIAAVLIFLGVGAIVIDSHVSVDANNVGIIQEFGKPVGDPVGPGWNWTAPWATVTSFSTQVETTSRAAGADGDTPTADCVQINFKDNASACADITISYRISDKNAVKMWQNYGSLDAVKTNLLRPVTNNAAKEAYGQYTSLEAISGSVLPEIGKKITDSMQSQLANSGLDLVMVSPGQLHLSDAANANLQKLQAAQIDTQVAQQTLAKNQALAAANNALNASLTDGIRFEDCLKIAAEIKTVGFTCVGSGSNMLLNVSGSNK